MITQHSELRALAEAATAGEWSAERLLGWDPNVSHIPETRVVDEHDRQVADCFDNTRWSDAACEANAKFIAAANPQRVIALLDQLAAAEAECAAMRAARDEVCGLLLDRIGDASWDVKTTNRIIELRKVGAK